MYVVVLLLTFSCSTSASAEEECGCLVYPDENYAECSDSNNTDIPTCVPDHIKRLHLLFNAEFLSNNSLSRFRSLEVLHIFGMPSLVLHRDLLRGLESLISLYIWFSNVKEIPVGFFKHTSSLTHLDLSSNVLQSIPEDLFADLSNLKYLSLANNSLETIEPSTFSSLHQLLWLNLYENPWNCDCKLKEVIRNLRLAQVEIGEAGCFQPDRYKGITLLRVYYRMSCMDSYPTHIHFITHKNDTYAT